MDCKPNIIEASEARTTVRTSRGDEFVIDADEAVKALAEVLSDEANESGGGWSLGQGWYESAINRMRKAVVGKHTPSAQRR
jgi:hypothetical protein